MGKLIVSKGLDLLFAAWPLVVDRVPDARLLVIGFGTYRDALGSFVEALRRADVEALREIAARGRELEGGPAGELKYLSAFLDTVDDDWLRAVRPPPSGSTSPGGSSTRICPILLPAVEAQVMPSTFPESFGMVAAEAAACGALPLSANHSGMAEVTATLAPALPAELRPLMSFEVGPGAVREIAQKLVDMAHARPRGARAGAGRAGRGCRRQYSWESVAEGVIEAASSPSSGSVPAP